MKYRLNELIVVPQNLTLYRKKNNAKVAEFIRLEPGYWYDQYGDDEVFIESLKAWEMKALYTAELENALTAKGIPFRKAKGCNCSGGRISIYFKGIVIDEDN